MEIASLSKVILLLLEKGKEVSLEGIGNFFIKREPARIDVKSSIAHPPTQTILFNPDIHFYDSELLHQIVKASDLEEAVAKVELSTLLKNILQRITNGEIVHLEGIGSLLIGDNGRVRFESMQMSEEGLPKVELPNLTKSIDETPLVMVRNGRGLENKKVRNGILVAVLSIVMFGIVKIIGIDFWKKNNPPALEKVLSDVPSSRINVKPQDIPASNLAEDMEKNTIKEYPDKAIQPVDKGGSEDDEQKSALLKKEDKTREISGVALIGVGNFSVLDDAKKLQASLERVDYKTIIQPSGNYLQLGIIVPYQSADHLNAVLLSIRRNFVSDASIETRFYEVAQSQ